MEDASKTRTRRNADRPTDASGIGSAAAHSPVCRHASAPSLPPPPLADVMSVLVGSSSVGGSSGPSPSVARRRLTGGAPTTAAALAALARAAATSTSYNAAHADFQRARTLGVPIAVAVRLRAREEEEAARVADSAKEEEEKRHHAHSTSAFTSRGHREHSIADDMHGEGTQTARVFSASKDHAVFASSPALHESLPSALAAPRAPRRGAFAATTNSTAATAISWSNLMALPAPPQNDAPRWGPPGNATATHTAPTNSNAADTPPVRRRRAAHRARRQGRDASAGPTSGSGTLSSSQAALSAGKLPQVDQLRARGMASSTGATFTSSAMAQAVPTSRVDLTQVHAQALAAKRIESFMHGAMRNGVGVSGVGSGGTTLMPTPPSMTTSASLTSRMMPPPPGTLLPLASRLALTDRRSGVDLLEAAVGVGSSSSLPLSGSIASLTSVDPLPYESLMRNVARRSTASLLFDIEADTEPDAPPVPRPALTSAQRAARASHLSDFLRDVWSAIVTDKRAGGIGPMTETNLRHSAERFERRFRRAHESALTASTIGFEEEERVLDLTGVGLGRAAGRVVARFVRTGGGVGVGVGSDPAARCEYADLRLGRNALGDEGIQPILKLLRRFKTPPTTTATATATASTTTLTSPTQAQRTLNQDGTEPLAASASVLSLNGSVAGTLAASGSQRTMRSAAATAATTTYDSLAQRSPTSPSRHLGAATSTTSLAPLIIVSPAAATAGTATTTVTSEAPLTSRPRHAHRPSNADVLLALRRQEHVSASAAAGAGAASSSAAAVAIGVVASAPVIRSLDLGLNSLGPQAFVDLASALPHSALRDLDLGSDHASDTANKMGEQGGAALAAALASVTCPLQSLRLAGVGSAGFLTLVRDGLLAAAAYSQLHTLDVRGNWLGADTFHLLMRACRRGLPHLARLGLAKNRFSTLGATLLCEYLQHTTSLRYLDLTMCCITPSTGVTPEPTTNHPTATTAAGTAEDHEHTNGDDTGAHGPSSNSSAALAAAAAAAAALPSRDFFSRFFESMARNRGFCTLEEVVFDENDVGDVGARQIGLALALLGRAHLPNLRTLSFINCNIADLQWLSYGLARTNRALTSLDLSSNPIGDGGAIALALALQGRLELDAPLLPILALRPERDDDEDEDEEAARAAAAAAEEKRQRRRELEERQRRRVREGGDQQQALLLDDLVRDPALLPTSGTAEIKAAHTITSPRLTARHLRSTSTVAAAAAAPAPRNTFYDLQPQQLAAARVSNAKRVIVYSQQGFDGSGLEHLRLTHVGMGDVGCVHLAQAIAMHGSLRELRLNDNDLTSHGGRAMVAALTRVASLDAVKVSRVALHQNRVSADLLARIDDVTRVRRTLDARQRLRALREECATMRRTQRHRFGAAVRAVARAMDVDEALAREHASRAEELVATRARETAATAALEAELAALRAPDAGVAGVALERAEVADQLATRVAALRVEHARQEEFLHAARAVELKTHARLRDAISGARSHTEQVRAEALLDLKPVRALFETETVALRRVKQASEKARLQRALLERTLVRAYAAILRACDDQEETLDPDAREWNDDSTTAMTEMTLELVPPSPSTHSLSSDESNLRGRRGVFFRGDSLTRSSREEERKSAASTAPSQPVSFVGAFASDTRFRAASPRTGAALRYLACFDARERGAVRQRVIAAALEFGRPLEQVAPRGEADIARLSPRTRGAVARLRAGLAQWEAEVAARARAEARAAATTTTATTSGMIASDAEHARARRRRSRAPLAAGTTGVPLGLASGALDPLSVDSAGGVGSNNGATSDGVPLTLSLDLVTSLLQLPPLTKVQGSTTVYNMIMHGLGHGGTIFVALHASSEAANMQAQWEEIYGKYHAGVGRRVRPPPPPPPIILSRGFESLVPSSSLASLLPPPPPEPITFTCASTTTSSGLIRLVSERLGIAPGDISALAYREKRAPDSSKASSNAAASGSGAGAGVGGGSSGGGDIVGMIRQKELEATREKKRRQAAAKAGGNHHAAAASTSQRRRSAHSPSSTTTSMGATMPTSTTEQPRASRRRRSKKRSTATSTVVAAVITVREDEEKKGTDGADSNSATLPVNSTTGEGAQVQGVVADASTSSSIASSQPTTSRVDSEVPPQDEDEEEAGEVAAAVDVAAAVAAPSDATNESEVTYNADAYATSTAQHHATAEDEKSEPVPAPTVAHATPATSPPAPPSRTVSSTMPRAVTLTPFGTNAAPTPAGATATSQGNCKDARRR